MIETRKTLIYAGVAVGLALLAFICSPKKITPDMFVDQGEAFYPEFTDPNEARTLEVVEYDDATGSPRAFKVTFENGRWVIPSHHNYPADAQDRLARTAAGVIDLKKDDYRSDNLADHESFGVVDPLDESAGLAGRGKRVTMKGAGGEVLFDLIIGNVVTGHPNLRYARLPDQKRVYATRADVEISTRFEDWIDSDLLQLAKEDVQRVVINDYTINERTRSVNRRDNLSLRLDGDRWTSAGMSSSNQIDSAVITDLLATLDDLTIVGIRPKPTGLSVTLKQASPEAGLSQSDRISLQQRGFYMTRDGQLMSNEGELLVTAANGVRYTLRFGEVVHGSGLAVTAGTDEGSSADNSGSAQNRYLFVTTEFLPDMFPEPAKPGDTDFQKKPDSLWSDTDRDNKARQDAHLEWQRQVTLGRQTSQELNTRFADWYYVISSESFGKLHRSRSELIVRKTAESSDQG